MNKTIYEDIPEVELPMSSTFTDKIPTYGTDFVDAIKGFTEAIQSFSQRCGEHYYTHQAVIIELEQLIDKLSDAITVINKDGLSNLNTPISRAESNKTTTNYTKTRYSNNENRQKSVFTNFQVSDTYFHIRRKSEMGQQEFLVQFIELVYLMLHDLRYSNIPINQLIYILIGIGNCIDYSLIKIRTKKPSRSPTKPISNNNNPSIREAFNKFWNTRGNLETTTANLQLSYFRWYVGHQASFIFMRFLAASLERLIGHFDLLELSLMDTRLHNIDFIFKGLSGLLWYIHDYPAQLYESHIAKQILEHSKKYKSGLSGIRGPEWIDLRKAINHVSHFLYQQTNLTSANTIDRFISVLGNELIFLENHAVLINDKISPVYVSIRDKMSRNPAARPSAQSAMRDVFCSRFQHNKLVAHDLTEMLNTH